MSAELKPQKVYLGKDTAQVQQIKCVVGTSLGAKYMLFFDSAGVKRYAWFNTGASVDPAPAGGWTGHEVAINSGDTASQVATKLAAVLTAVSGFDATASGVYVTLTHTVVGYAEPARDGAAATGFAFKVTTLGQAKRSLGCLQGDIELAGLEKQMVAVTCHASGTTKQDDIVSGMGEVQVTLNLQETSKAEIEKILQDYGNDSYTPEGADKERIFGLGTGQVGKSVRKTRLEMHPVALEDADKSEDQTFWLCSVNLDTIGYSGENPTVVPVTVMIYPDSSKPKAIAYGMIGDAALAGY